MGRKTELLHFAEPWQTGHIDGRLCRRAGRPQPGRGVVLDPAAVTCPVCRELIRPARPLS